MLVMCNTVIEYIAIQYLLETNIILCIVSTLMFVRCSWKHHCITSAHCIGPQIKEIIVYITVKVVVDWLHCFTHAGLQYLAKKQSDDIMGNDFDGRITGLLASFCFYPIVLQ